MSLKQTLRNKNWRAAQYIEDEDGFVIFDETEGLDRTDVRKFVTMEGELYHFIREPHGFFRRLWYDFQARFCA